MAREAVIWAYRLILDREPESEEAIRHAAAAPSVAELVAGMLKSEEFLDRNAGPLCAFCDRLAGREEAGAGAEDGAP